MDFRTLSDSEIVSCLPQGECIEIVRSCLAQIGKVTSLTDVFIEGKIRFGFQNVNVRISWVSDSEGTRFVLQALSDDIWNAGGKNVKNRLLQLIKNHNNTGYKVDRLGMHPIALVALGSLFVLIIGFIVTKLL